MNRLAQRALIAAPIAALAVWIAIARPANVFTIGFAAIVAISISVGIWRRMSGRTPPLTRKRLYRNALAMSPLVVFIGWTSTLTFILQTPLPFLPTLVLNAFAIAASYGIFREMRERERGQ